MNRKYNLKLDLQFRCNNSTMKFRQSDNKTSDFFIRITRSGELFDVNNAIAILAVIKPDNTSQAQFLEIKEGKVYADLNNNMKDQVGKYKAQALLIMEDERVSTDVIEYDVTEDNILNQLEATVSSTDEFTMLQEILSRLSNIEQQEEQRMINEAERILSEENRKIEEAKRVEAELIRQHEEADRAKYDATRESNENIRKQNESLRLANETNRIDEEAKRVEEEAKRVEAEQLRKDNYNFMTEDEERRRSEANAHKEAEKLRAQAENTRVNEEAKRRTTEQARVSAENTRVSNENTRKANEVTRQTNETHRVEAETQRQNRYNSFIADAEINANNFENYTNSAKIKEEERKSNELNRKSQEDRRVSNEVERISNENTRKANEVAREKNETSRQYVFENKVNEVDKKIIEINTTKDNFVSSINTKVDTKISELNTTKDNFVSSVNTKVDTKISELDDAKSDMATTVSNKVNEVETRFNALTSSQQQDAEVIDARDGETSLKVRLDRDIEKAKQVYVNVEGSHISTDSSVGYLKDIEILGNTIQSASNLADIKSVGDKVEGQELYEIPVLSCGKNLFDGVIIDKALDVVTGSLFDDANWSTTNYIMVNSDKITFSTNTSVSEINNLNFTVVMYDTNYKAIGNVGFYNNNSGTWTLIPNTKYIRVRLPRANYSNIQIEEGTVATPYEPYQEDKLTILSPTPLEKVGDVRDRLIEKDGVWGVEKNVNSGFIPSSANWLLQRNNGTVNRFVCLTSNMPFTDFIRATNNVISNKFIACDNISDYTIGCMFGNNDGFVVHTNIQDIPTLVDFKNFIGDGVCVKYPTTQPTFIPLPHDQQVKLRTFAGKTNISFGCEIEGMIKAQVPKSLGATVNTHTEQINNLNKELDRVKKLEESTVSTVTTESGFTTVEATSNGYFEDVKLEGKTLANIVTTYDTSRFSLRNAIKQEDSYFKLQYGATVNDSYVIPRHGVHLYKPNTTYTIIVDIKENTTETFLGISAINSCIDSTTISKKDFTNLTGISTITFKTRDDITISDKGMRPTYALYFGIWKDGGDLSKHITFRYWVLEGDHTQNPPSYFEGLKSVGQSATTSEDDVDEMSVESVDGGINNRDNSFTEINISTGLETIDRTIITTGLNCISADDGKVYLYKNGDRCSNIVTRRYYSKNKVYLGVTYTNDAYYVRFRFLNASGNYEGDISEYKVINSTMKESQADKKRLLYYNTETQMWEKPILREWDSIEKHTDGKYYYHVRSIEEDYVEGDEIVTDYITDMTTTVKPLSQEKIYECTNMDLITYNGETNYIVESGAIVPKTTLKVHNNISNVVSLLQKKVSLLESNVTSYMTTQNRLMLASRYNSDAVSFKVDYAVCSENMSQENYDTDLYNLILNNILVGKDNYDYNHMFNIIMDYASWSQISWDQFDILVGLMDIQHNPPIEEIPTDDEIVEEIPNEIM